MGRIVRRVIGAGIAVFAIYLLAFVNVDVPDRTKPSVCGPGPVRVLLFGQTRNHDLLSGAQCRASAGFIALFCAAMGAIGVALVVGWLPATWRAVSDPDAEVIRPPTWTRRVTAATAPCLGFLLLGMLTSTDRYALVVASVPVLALFAWQSRRMTDRPRVEVTPDALHVHGTSRAIAVPLADIVRVSATSRGIRVHRRRGRPVLLPLAANGGPYGRAVAERLRALIGQAGSEYADRPARAEPVDTTIPVYEYLLLVLTGIALVGLILAM